MIQTQFAGLGAGPRLDRLGFSRFHLRMLGLIGAGMFLDGFELYLTAGLLGALTKSGWSSMTLNASFVSSTFLGMVVGAWFAGVLGDRYGRRFTYQFNLAVFGLASLAAVFAPSMQVLIGLRFVMGVGLGAEIVVGYATLTEFVPAAIRGRLIGWLAVMTNVSLLVATFIGMWVIPNLGWRYMFLIVGVGALIVWLLRKSMPESPRWLESQGRIEEADAILRAIERVSPVRRTIVAAPVAMPAAAPAQTSVWVVFSPSVIGRTLMGCLLNVVMGFCLYGFISWLPTFFVKQGVSIAASLAWTTVMSLGAPTGAVIGLLLADRVGRKPMIVACSLAAAAFGVLFPLVGNGYPLMLVGFCLFTAIYVLLAIGFALHVPELFPTEYRMRGTAVCSTAGRLVTASVQFVVIALFSWGGLAGVVGSLVALLLFQAIVIGLFGIETRQRTLEDISLPLEGRPEAAPVSERVASGAVR